MFPAISLKSLLSVFLALIFLLLGTTLFLANLSGTRDFLQQQLGNHAQDAANTLAFQLAPALAGNDLAAVTGSVDALFDSGGYRRIRIVRPGGETLLERERPPRVDGPPDWFVRALPLEAAVVAVDAAGAC